MILCTDVCFLYVIYIYISRITVVDSESLPSIRIYWFFDVLRIQKTPALVNASSIPRPKKTTLAGFGKRLFGYVRTGSLQKTVIFCPTAAWPWASKIAPIPSWMANISKRIGFMDVVQCFIVVESSSTSSTTFPRSSGKSTRNWVGALERRAIHQSSGALFSYKHMLPLGQSILSF